MTDIDDDLDAILEHHGIKGMHWGVRKDRDTGSGSSREHELKKMLAAHGITSDSLRQKFGPGSMSPPKQSSEKSKAEKENPTRGEQKAHHLSKNQKIVIGVGAAAVLAGLAIYGANKLGSGTPDIPEHLLPEGLLRGKGETDFDKYIDRQTIHFNGLTQTEISHLGKVDHVFSAGHVFKRLSTEKEHDIRPDGFYAVSNDKDLQHYKEILPLYWKEWGHNVQSGHIVHLSSNQEVKAPSERVMFEWLKHSIQHDAAVKDEYYHLRYNIGSVGKHKDDYEYQAAKLWPAFSVNLNDLKSPTTKRYFAFLKKNGYNATIDTNDAGVLAEKPLRMIDGTIFNVINHEVFGESEVKSAFARRDGLIPA